MTASHQHINLPKFTRSNYSVKLTKFIDDFKAMDAMLEKLDDDRALPELGHFMA